VSRHEMTQDERDDCRRFALECAIASRLRKEGLCDKDDPFARRVFSPWMLTLIAWKVMDGTLSKEGAFNVARDMARKRLDVIAEGGPTSCYFLEYEICNALSG